MKAKLVDIGDSRGVQLPASIIEQCGLGDEIEVRVENNRVVLAPVGAPRSTWESAFATMAAEGDDDPVWPDTGSTVEDSDESW